MNWSNPRTCVGAIAVAVVVAITVSIVQQHKITSSELQRQSAVAERDEAVAGRERALAGLKLKEQELKTAQEEKSELLRLRSEVARLLEGTKHKEQPISTKSGAAVLTPEPGAYISKEQLAFVGFATPQNCWESCVWAMLSGNYEAMTNSFGPEMQHEFEDPQMRADFETMMKTNAQNFSGMQILARKEIGEDKVELKILMRDKTDEISIEPMLKVGNEWKRYGSSRGYSPEWEKNGRVETFARR